MIKGNPKNLEEALEIMDLVVTKTVQSLQEGIVQARETGPRFRKDETLLEKDYDPKLKGELREFLEKKSLAVLLVGLDNSQGAESYNFFIVGPGLYSRSAIGADLAISLNKDPKTGKIYEGFITVQADSLMKDSVL